MWVFLRRTNGVHKNFIMNLTSVVCTRMESELVGRHNSAIMPVQPEVGLVGYWHYNLELTNL